MTDRPILFSAPMVRALLDGRKTQTRRIIKPRGKHPSLFNDGWTDSYVLDPGNEEWRQKDIPIKLGDRLWVREEWSGDFAWHSIKPSERHPSERLWFWADGNPDDGDWERPRPSIHMPRWASRLTLTVTEVRAERLQDISEADAIAEGVLRQDPTPEDWEWYRGYADEHGLDPNDPNGVSHVWLAPGTRQGFGPRKDAPQWGPTAAFAYRLLWDSINGSGAWDANPWVAAYTFTIERKNIGEVSP